MNLPTLDIGALPDLTGMAGAFGSLTDAASAVIDDRVIIIMVYVYEMAPPEAALLV